MEHLAGPPSPKIVHDGITFDTTPTLVGTANPHETVTIAVGGVDVPGTALADGKVVVSSGRVVCVAALGDSIRQAQRAAYGAVAAIHFDGMQYRTDIGFRALSRQA